MNEIFQKYKKSKAFFIAFCVPLGLTACDDKYEVNSYMEDNQVKIEEMKKEDVLFSVSALDLPAPPNVPSKYEWSIESQNIKSSKIYLDSVEAKVEKWSVVCESPNISVYGSCNLIFSDSIDDRNQLVMSLKLKELNNVKELFKDMSSADSVLPEINMSSRLYYKNKYGMVELLSYSANIKKEPEKLIISKSDKTHKVNNQKTVKIDNRVYKIELSKEDLSFLAKQIENYLTLTKASEKYRNTMTVFTESISTSRR